MFNNYNNLGFHSKYYTFKEEKINVAKTFNESVNSLTEKEIDTTSIIEFINRFYFFGDRTIVKNLSKTPWLAKPNELSSKWEFNTIPDELQQITTELEFTNFFIEKVEQEIITYIGNAKKIGILLTGGMDSRVVAAIVNKLNNEKRINVTVRALTWGMENSRDIVYAKEIAKKYHWESKSFKLNAEILKQNIQITADEGCEFSPIHLHGMNEVSKEKDLDLILAGSFGDSIGRAEYSSKHASKLTSIATGISNKFFFLNHNQFKKSIKNINTDIKKYSNQFPRNLDYANFEIEQMAHYMRRELNPCMTLIDRKTPLYQVFAAAEVYKFVLNVPIELRNDNLYFNVLNKVDQSLLEIPWARTGKPYLKNDCLEDTTYTKGYHEYGKWIKNDLAEYINDLIFNGNLESLNIFNMKAIKYAIKINNKSNLVASNRIDEIIVWLASLSILIEKNNVNGVKKQTTKFGDFITLLKSKFYSSLYIKVRSLKK